MSFDLVSPLLNFFCYSPLLLDAIGPDASFVLSSRSPDRLVRLRILFKLIDEIIKVLLLLFSIL